MTKSLTWLDSLSAFYTCLFSSHLPSLAAPPAGVSGDVQTFAACFFGYESEFPDCTASEASQVHWWHWQAETEQEATGQQETPPTVEMRKDPNREVIFAWRTVHNSKSFSAVH